MTTGTMLLKNWWADEQRRIVGEIEGVTHVIWAHLMQEYYDYGDHIVIKVSSGEKFQLNKTDKRVDK